MVYLTCFSCQDKLLRHIRNKNLYWYCSSCRQEISEATISSIGASKDRRSNLNLNKLQPKI